MKKSISYYRAAMFLSSSFFLNYWSKITNYQFNDKDVELITSEFRQIVSLFMNGEDSLWNISFKHDDINKIEDKIDVIVETKFRPIQAQLALIINIFEEDNPVIDMISNFLYRVGSDIEFCIEEGISPKTHELLNLCIDTISMDNTALFDMDNLWQRSESKWDNYIKSLTPDQPDYICDFFIVNYLSGKMFSHILNTLEEITDSEEKNRCLCEIKQAMLNYYSSDTIVNDAVKLIPLI